MGTKREAETQRTTKILEVKTSVSSSIHAKASPPNLTATLLPNTTSIGAYGMSSQMKRLNIDEIYSNDMDFDVIPGVKRVFK